MGLATEAPGSRCRVVRTRMLASYSCVCVWVCVWVWVCMCVCVCVCMWVTAEGLWRLWA